MQRTACELRIFFLPSAQRHPSIAIRKVSGLGLAQRCQAIAFTSRNTLSISSGVLSMPGLNRAYSVA